MFIPSYGRKSRKDLKLLLKKRGFYCFEEKIKIGTINRLIKILTNISHLVKDLLIIDYLGQ